MADGGVWEGRRGERKMMVQTAWIEEGPNSGDMTMPSSAMADAAVLRWFTAHVGENGGGARWL